MPFLVLTIAIGLSSVIQAGLNRQMGTSWGLPSTVLLNAIMFLLAALIYYGLARLSIVEFPLALSEKYGFQHWQWWYFLPGLLGFAFVIGVPFSIAKIGALQVFVGLVLAQMLGGLVWDRWVEGLDWTWSRLLGAVLAVVAVLLASR